MARGQEDGHGCSGGVCSASECCSARCWMSGWRDNGDSSGSHQCPSGQMARGQEDGHGCSGGVCSASECCSARCWMSGWRDNGDSSGSHECAAGQMARSQHDEHMCSGDACVASDCCSVRCWMSGWRDNGDSSGSHQCPSGQMARGQEDGHGCSGGVCSASECCGETCAIIDPASCPDGKQRRRGEEMCHGSACSTDHCCFVGCKAWADAGNTCTGGLAIKEDESCDGGSVSGCDADKCCTHPLEIKCQKPEAMSCSTCAKYAPCVSSIDQRCISQEALDCLHCEPLSECAVCAPEWDNKCYTTSIYQDVACTNLDFSIPQKFDECFLLPPFASNGYSLTKTDGTYKNKCTDDTCSDCSESGTHAPSAKSFFDLAKKKKYFAEGACETDDDRGEGVKTRGLIDETKPGNPCPTAKPCGPASCVPGVDKKCIVFAVFGKTSKCDVADLQGDGVEAGSGSATTIQPAADYHAYAIGDNTCRMDGNGRSYYRLTIDRAADSGTGVIGCTDAKCSVDCAKVAMSRAVCSTPSWANGLQLVANAIVSDWPAAAYTHKVAMSVTIAGTIDQFTKVVLTSMRQKVRLQPCVFEAAFMCVHVVCMFVCVCVCVCEPASERASASVRA